MLCGGLCGLERVGEGRRGGGDGADDGIPTTMFIHSRCMH